MLNNQANLDNHLHQYPYILTCDIGKEVSVAFLGKKDGSCLKDCWEFSHCLLDYERLIKGLDPQETLVGFEATGHYWLSLYEFLIRKGFLVVILNPLQVKSFRDSCKENLEMSGF